MKSRKFIEYLYSLSLEKNVNEGLEINLPEDDELKKADEELESYEEFLPDDKKVDFINATCDYTYYCEKNAFKLGFMYGVRLMSEAFTDK